MQTLDPVPYEAPAIEPATIDQFKLHAKIETTDEDESIQFYAKSCRRSLEKMLGISMIETTWDEYLDVFPCNSGPIRLTRSPLLSIESLTYTNLNGQEIELVEETDFVVDNVRRPPRIYPKYGTYWPTDTDIRPNAIKVRYKAGYGTTPDKVPEDLIIPLFLIFTSTYENRRVGVDYEQFDVPIPVSIRQLLTSNTVWSF